MDALSKINDAMEIKGLWKELIAAVKRFLSTILGNDAESVVTSAAEFFESGDE